MTENIVTSIEQFGQLIVGILEVAEAVLPQAHILETAVSLLIGMYPVGRTKGHHHHKEAHEAQNSSKDNSICK